MQKQQIFQVDIKNNKIKEGLITKQSRHLKQWRQRWLVLTKTHLYTFAQKNVYKNPTQVIPLATIINIKAYYKKGNFQKPNVFRIQTPDILFYISTVKSQQKWAWMTAIEKMLIKALYPSDQPDASELIRQTLMMSSAIRNTLNKVSNSQNNQPNMKINKIMNKFKLDIFNKQVNETILLQSQNKNIIQEKIVQKKVQVPVQKIVQKKVQVPVQKIVEKKIQVQKIVEKRVEVPVQKIVEKKVQVQKIVYVPQYRQKIVQKIIYDDGHKGKDFLTGLFEDIISSKNLNPKPMIDFGIFVLTSKLEKYHSSMMQFFLSSQNQRFLAEIFLIMLNQQTDEIKLNIYLQFLTIVYQNTGEYLYSSDIKVLIDIILREMQLNRSQFNQFLLLSLLKALAQKNWWKKDSHRVNQIKMLVKELQTISGPQNQMVIYQLIAVL